MAYMFHLTSLCLRLNSSLFVLCCVVSLCVYIHKDSFPGSDVEETRHEDSLVQNTPNCLKIKVCSAKNLRAVDNT